MRKHGWQLPYHPLQVVAIAVFLALGVAFYVFFAPFLRRKKLEYWAIGLYTPLISCVFFVYVWCAATDPGDEGIFRSKKYLNVTPGELHTPSKGSRRGNGSISSVNEENAAAFEEKWRGPCSCLFSLCHPRGRFSEQQTSEDGSFFCSLCEVEVYKYSKHCRICDKCVDGFDHHCRWLNNCIGRKNYLGFFILMVSALLLLILQWSVGVFILIRCLLKKSEFTGDIKSKLGSSFSFPAFLLVVGSSSFLAMVATLPLAQLFFFHVLLVKKGISTYDYIVALREQEQQGVRSLQSPTMSPVSSITGLSSTSSFTHFRRGAWCTPPRLFLEDHQFDVALPESGGSFRSVAEGGKNPAAVKINPWKLARMNGDDVAKAAAEARKRSRVLRPAAKREIAAGTMEMDSSFGSSSGRMLPVVESLRAAMSKKAPARGSAAAPLQVAARDVFTGASGTARYPESSSPDSPPSFRPPGVFSGAGHSRKGVVLQPHQRRSSSGSDGYEASGGEDSDRIPAAAVHRLPVWNNLCEPSGADTSGELVRAPRPQNRGRS